MGRRPCCAKVGLNKGAWSAMEDKILTTYIHTHGEGQWRDLPDRAGLKRCGKSCRLRWLNYLRPDIKRGNISKEEEDLIVKLHNLLGNRWSLIAGRLPGRTDNEIKNYWNTTLCKRVQQNRNQKDNREKAYNATSSPIKLVDQHEVIRTKAARCTKVVIPKELNGGGLGNNDSPASLTCHSGFLMDFDINDLLETDTMNPNFDQLFYVKENNNGSGSEEGFFSCLAQFDAKDEQGIMNEPMDFGPLYSLFE